MRARHRAAQTASHGAAVTYYRPWDWTRPPRQIDVGGLSDFFWVSYLRSTSTTTASTQVALPLPLRVLFLHGRRDRTLSGIIMGLDYSSARAAMNSADPSGDNAAACRFSKSTLSGPTTEALSA